MLRTFIQRRRCLLSCCMKVLSFTVEESPGPTWETSYVQRCRFFQCYSHSSSSWCFEGQSNHPVFRCRWSAERQRSGKMLTRPPDPCVCVWSVTCWRWSAAWTALTAWMMSAWGHSAFTNVCLDSTAHSQGLFSTALTFYEGFLTLTPKNILSV